MREIFERARAAQEWIPPMEADLLYSAALRKAVEQGVPLSPAKVMLREGGVLEIVMQDKGPEPESYRAPEEAAGDARRVDARAQVYSAGAVGYELFTGLPPPRPPHGPGPELTGPLGDVVRIAMAQDRRERFNDLQQLFDAVSVIEPNRSPPEERGLLAALLARVKRWEERAQNASAMALLRHEYETIEARLAVQETLIARLSTQEPMGERFGMLETALQAVRAEATAGLARQQQNLRELVEDQRRAEAKEREREETREARLALHPPRAPLLPVIGAAVLAGVLASVATGFVLERARPESAQREPTPVAAAPRPVEADAAPAPANPSSARAEIPAANSPAPSNPSVPAPVAPMVGVPTNSNPAPAPLVAPVPVSPAPTAPARFAEPHPAPTETPAPTSPLAVVVPEAKAPETPKRKAHSLLDRGDTALEKGHPEAAILAFQNALAADPGAAEAHRGLGMAYALQGNDAEAKKEYELYLHDAPSASDAADIRAAINELNQRSKLGDAP